MRHAWSVIAVAVLCCSAEAAQKELSQSQRFPASPGKRVVVDAANVGVQVRSADIREVEVATELSIRGVSEERATSWVERHTPTLADSPDAVRVEVRPGADGFMWLGHLTARARIAVAMPPFAVPDLTTSSGDISVRGDFPTTQPVLLRTASGQVEMLGAATGVDARSASGDITVEVVRPLERLFARTASGDVTLEGGARQVEVDTASGDVRLSDLSGSVAVETSSGKIVLAWDRLEADSVVKVKTSSGRVQLVVPAGTTARGTIRTTDGTIRSDLPGVVSEAGDAILLEGSGPTLDVESASGDVVVGYSLEWPKDPPPAAPTGS